MLKKNCELCGNTFSCQSDEKSCWCEKIKPDSKKLDVIKNFGQDCFCENCMNEIDKSQLTNLDNEINIETKEGMMKMVLKKKNDNLTLEIMNKKFRYPILSEECDYKEEANMRFTKYSIKLKNNRFKIIRNIEALDENYRRVFSRVKYGILFL